MRRQTFRDVLTAIALSNLLLLRTWAELLTPHGRGAYFLNASRATFVAVMVNVILLGLAGAAAVTLSRRSSQPHWLTVGKYAFLGLLIIPLEQLRGQLGIRLADLLAWLGHAPGLGKVTLAIVFLGVVYELLRRRHLVVRAASTLVLFSCPFVAVTFARATWAAATFTPPAPSSTKPTGSTANTGSSHTGSRVVVLVFDELDQRLAFDDRPPDVSLPQLDRLRSASLYAPHVAPAGSRTEISMPALITSRPIAAVSPQGPDELGLSYVGVDSVVPWSRQSNLFARAHELGARTGLVGWYHPYCRVLAGDLDRCFWEPFYTVISRDASQGVIGNMIEQLGSLWPWTSRRIYIGIYQRTLDSAQAMATDSTLGLVLLHLPMPHLPPVYDRHASGFTLHKYGYDGYLDNLVLMDHALGALRGSLEAAGWWDRTTLVLTSDHAFREATRIDGRQDRRVPFLIKVAGQKEGVTYSAPFDTFVLDDLVIAVIRGEGRTPPEIVALLDRLRTHAVGQDRR